MENSTKSILWMGGWSMAFSTVMLLNRSLGNAIPLATIVWGRCFFALFFLAPFLSKGWNEQYDGGKNRWNEIILHGIRGLSISGSMACTYTAYGHLPTHTAAILGSTGPLFTILFSMPLLHEFISSKQWVIIGVGYVGVWLLIQPQQVDIEFYAWIHLLGNALYGLSIVCARLLALRNVSARSILFYGSLLPFLLYTSLFLFEWQSLSWVHWGTLALMGASGSLSQWCYFRALSISPASFLAPFEYLRLCILLPLGFFFFSEVPSGQEYRGSLLILLSSLWLSRQKLPSSAL